MPPLRPTAYPRYRGYVCPSCSGKLQAPRRPPWMVRNVGSNSGQQGLNKDIRQKTQQAAHQVDESLKVRHFDEVSKGVLEGAVDVISDDTVKELKSRITALEANLEKLKAGDFVSPGSSLVDQLLSDENSPLALRKHSLGKAIPPSIGTVARRSIKIPLNQFPEDRRKNISKLNQALENFARQQSSSTYIKDLRKWYSHSRNNLSSAWYLVPSSAWTLLWDAFSRGSAENPNRMAHIRRLGEDIKAAGAQLDRPQTLLYIESLFMEGDKKEAIRQWEASQTALAYETAVANMYWALGVKMLASDSEPERAEQATEFLINGLNDGGEPRVLISIIRYWLESGDQAAVQRAWAIYVRLKFILASDMEMRDYDAVMGAFLEVEQTDLALAVFRDMMLSGDSFTRNNDSVAVYKSVFKSVKNLRSFKLTLEEIGWTSHEPFTILPKKQQNKYFYGSWIKKLIGDGQVDWAVQIAGLMYQRNIVPDPRHMNGIIGAWLRSGAAGNQQKAEDLAWKMIGARLDFVKARDRFGLQHPLRPVITLEKKGFDRPSRFSQVSTLATIETFCILINYYQRRRRGDRVQEICAAVEAARIKPNTSFMNDLLLVGAMQNRKHWSWNAYNQLVRADGVIPDYDTFTILWQMMKDHLEGTSKAEFPSPRILFCEMAKWPLSLKQGSFSRDAYKLVLECFTLADDQIGSLIALRAMQQLFGIYPNEETVANTVLQLAKTGNRKIASQLPRRQQRTKDLQSRVSGLTGAFRDFEQKRAKSLSGKGIILDDTGTTARPEELLIILANLLRFGAQSTLVHPFNSDIQEGSANDHLGIRLLLETAIKEMGVSQRVFVSSVFDG